MARRPPGPEGELFLGSLPELARDWLGFLRQCVERHGDIVWLRLGEPLPPAVLLAHPAHIRRALVEDAGLMRKSVLTRRVRPVVGEGIFTSDGPRWLRHRRMMQPAFHRARVEGYAQIISREVERTVCAWEQQAPGAPRDALVDATELALRVNAGALFGAEIAGQVPRIGAAMAALDEAVDGWLNARAPRPEFVAGESVQRVRGAVRELESILDQLVAERRRHGGVPADLLGLLLEARDDETDRGLDERELRDEVMTLLLAGFGASALGITWLLGLLAHHPEVADGLAAEASAVLDGRAPRADDLPRLTLCDAVVRESLRLYPPTWLIAHSPRQDWSVGGYDIPADTTILMSTWLTQRDPRFFEQPERFRPERWLDGSVGEAGREAWFPFGGGPRVCIGQAFAMMELLFLLAVLAPRVRIEPVSPVLPRPLPAFTLQPEGGMWLRFGARGAT